METLFQDLCFGVRMLRRNPGFTAVAVLTLALGIGVNTSIFTLVNAVLLRPLPYPKPAQLVQILKDRKSPGHAAAELRPEFEEKDLRAFLNEPDLPLQIAAFAGHEANLSGSDQAERVSCGAVTPSLLTVLGVNPLLGRNFLLAEDQPGVSRVVILSHRLWQRRFGGDPQIIGKNIRLNELNCAVVGVLPVEAQLPGRFDLLLPETLSQEMLHAKKMWVFPHIIGRLPTGTSRQKAEAMVEHVYQSLSHPREQGRIVLKGFQEQMVSGIRRSLLVFQGAVVMILLIAWVNVSSLLLARVASRRKELAVRAALGASPARMMRQLLTETFLLCLFGALFAVVFSAGSKHLLQVFTRNLPAVGGLSIDLRILSFTFALSLLSGSLFGLAPALFAVRASFTDSVKEAARTSTSGVSAHWVRGFLVILEVALAVVLLLGSGLLVKSFMRLRGIDPGFRPDRMLSFTIDLSLPRYPDSRSQSAYFEELIARLKTIPEIQAIAADATLPFSPWALSGDLEIEGHALPGREVVYMGVVNPDYFRALGISLLRGQLLNDKDRAGVPGVVVVNDRFVRRYFPSEDPIGKRIQTWGDEWKTIVGVVGDVRIGLEREPDPMVYHSYLQTGVGVMSFAVKTSGAPLHLARAVQQCAAMVDKDQPVYSVLTMEQRLKDSLAPRRTNMVLLGTFSLLALGLAAIGIYGVIASLVSQRTHEIGVRMALGATRRSVLNLVLGSGLLLVLPGIVLGLLGGVGLTRAIASQLYAVPATDPTTFCVVSVALIITALAACLIPARRASIIEPMEALRYE